MAAVIAVGGAGYYSIAFVVRWWRWHDPITVGYLIPRNKYAMRTFLGAPDGEQVRDTLAIRPGEYFVLLKIEVKTEIEIDDAPWRFAGNAGDIIDHGGGDSPNLIQAYLRKDGRRTYKDWHGELHNSATGGPYIHKPGDEWIMGHRIEARQAYIGELEVSFVMRGHKTIKKRLAFIIDPDGHDDIPFLKEDDVSRTRR